VLPVEIPLNIKLIDSLGWRPNPRYCPLWEWLKYNQVSFRKISVNAMNPTIEQAQTILNQQTITETSPGTILQDFQTFLNLLQDEGIEVSGKHRLFPLKKKPLMEKEF